MTSAYSVLALPMRSAGATLGVLSVYQLEGSPPLDPSRSA